LESSKFSFMKCSWVHSSYSEIFWALMIFERLFSGSKIESLRAFSSTSLIGANNCSSSSSAIYSRPVVSSTTFFSLLNSESSSVCPSSPKRFFLFFLLSAKLSTYLTGAFDYSSFFNLYFSLNDIPAVFFI